MYKCLPTNLFKDQDGYELLPIRYEDREEIRKWRNSQMRILRQNKPLTEEDQTRYFDTVILPSFQEDEPSQVLFSFLFNGKLIGYGGLTHINWHVKRGEVSFLLATEIEENSQEFVTCFSHFLKLILQVAFETLQFHKISAEVYDFRPEVPKVLEEFGFALEGHLKDHIFKEGKVHGALLFGLINHPKTHHKGVLVTSIARKVPLIKAVQHAARKASFSAVVGSDSNDNIIGRYFVTTFWKWKGYEEMTSRDVIDYLRKHNISCVIPSKDDDLKFFSKYLQDFDKENIHVMVSDKNVIDLCTDKKRFADFLLEQGLPAIDTTTKIEECIASHYVVKERYGASGRKTAIKLNHHEAKEHAKRLDHPIFQPYITGAEYSIDLYRSLEKKVHGAIVRKRNLIMDGEAQITTTVENQELKDMAIKIADLLDIYGHAVIQIIVTGDGSFHILECNPRFGGASTVSLHAGLDSFYWFLLESQGITLQNHPFKPLEFAIRQVRYPQDKIISWQ